MANKSRLPEASHWYMLQKAIFGRRDSRSKLQEARGKNSQLETFVTTIFKKSNPRQ